MELNIGYEVATLQRLSVGQLRQRFAELFGETTPASNRTWLVKRIVWRMQALAEGDLSELARDADLRLNPPPSKAKTIPPPPLQRLGRDPLALEEMLTTVRQQDEARVAEWEGERLGLERDLLHGQSEVRKLLAEVGSGEFSSGAVTRLAELQARLAQVEQRLAHLRGQMEAWQQERLDQAAMTEALSGLVPAWERMTPEEQARVVRLLVSRVDYDGKASITFQPLGLKTLAGEMLGRSKEEQRA